MTGGSLKGIQIISFGLTWLMLGKAHRLIVCKSVDGHRMFGEVSFCR